MAAGSWSSSKVTRRPSRSRKYAHGVGQVAGARSPDGRRPGRCPPSTDPPPRAVRRRVRSRYRYLSAAGGARYSESPVGWLPTATPPHGRSIALDTGTSTLDAVDAHLHRGRRHDRPRSRGSCGSLRGPTTVVVDTSVPPGVGDRRSSSARTSSARPTRSRRTRSAPAGRRPAGRRVRRADPPALGPRRQLRPVPRCDGRSSSRPSCAMPIAPGRFFRGRSCRPTLGWGTPPYLVPNLRHGRRASRSSRPACGWCPAPGHTPGSQAVVVDTEHGSFCIAGRRDLHLREHRRDIPPGLPRRRGRVDGHRWTGSARRPTTSCRRTTTRSSRDGPVTPRSARGPRCARSRSVRPLMLALRKRQRRRHDARRSTEVPLPDAGSGPGAHRGHGGRHVRHRPAHPRRGLRVPAAGDARPRDRRAGGCGRRQGWMRGWLGALVAPETAFAHVRPVRLVPDRATDALPRAACRSAPASTAGSRRPSSCRAAKLHRLPDWLDEHAAALMEPLACGCNAIFDPGVVEAGDTVVVIGAGPVGLLAAQLARVAGGRVVVVGTAGDRRATRRRRRSASRPAMIDEPTDRASAGRRRRRAAHRRGGGGVRCAACGPVRADVAPARGDARPDGPAIGRRSASRSGRS